MDTCDRCGGFSRKGDPVQLYRNGDSLHRSCAAKKGLTDKDLER